MLPSLLARDIQHGLKQFLVTGFEPSDAFFHGLMQRFVDDERSWMKGPYLQVGLPFRFGNVGKGFFGSFQLRFPGYTHQEQAWARLASQRGAAHTLVATGTGSGKTECFLYPALEHAMRSRQAGEKGIKALVIYPMNALASDQARRFAETIAATPQFAGLRVGLYVGGRITETGAGMLMTADSVITDRDTLRKAPPDVLLTNYKMLDYLLIRPRDRALWQHNSSTTLRYVVVDELHTFDGAQGTDLALLLRRLRARLKVPAKHLIFTGTSATLGNTADTLPLREYARQVFGSEFVPESVIVEDRLSVAEFLGDAAIEHVLQWHADLPERLEARQHGSQEAAVAAWFQVFFPDAPIPADVTSVAWRQQLGELLKRHLLFVNLLKLLRGGIIALNDLHTQMQGPLPEAARPHIAAVLDALLVLVAWAREPSDPKLPLVTLRLQLWLRELRRMVAKVAARGDAVALRTAADLRSHPDGQYLPLIQCSECHTTGWLSRLPKGGHKLSTKLEEIYNGWFDGSPDSVRLYPGLTGSRQQCDGVPSIVCTSCGNVQGHGTPCQACGQDVLVPVFRTTGTRNTTRGQAQFAWHDTICPACASRDRLILLGARIATLGAQVIEQSWASPYNDDKKLIAFSDSVQDAAHRAGFFGARTYVNTVRTAMGHALAQFVTPRAAWPDFLARFGTTWLEASSPLNMSRERFVAEFIGPNMTWLRDWAEEVLHNGALPPASRLPERVIKRLQWQAFSEFTYLSQRGRNLDRIGLATLAVKTSDVADATHILTPRLRERLGMRELDDSCVFQWLWGFLTHLKRRGAVWHPELVRYAEDGSLFGMLRTAGRGEWMPNMGERAPHPVFLTLGTHRDFDRLANTRQHTWYERWAEATLGSQTLLSTGQAEVAYRLAIDELELRSLLRRARSERWGDAVGLNDEALELCTDVTGLTALAGRHRLTVPSDVIECLKGMPCLDAPAQPYDRVDATTHWLADRFTTGDLRRVIAAEHTGLLERDERESLELRFKSAEPKPWYENLLSATPTLEMGVDIGSLSSVMLCAVPPNQASFLQRIGRAGRRDGNALATTLADGGSPHDMYFFEETEEMMAGEVVPPGVFLQAAEVLKRQLFAFCLDDWVASGVSLRALPDKTADALQAVEKVDKSRFPYTFLDHVLTQSPRLLDEFLALLGQDINERVAERLTTYYEGTGDDDGLRVRLLKLLEELASEKNAYRKRIQTLKALIDALAARPQDEATRAEIEQLRRERESAMSLVTEINQRDLLNTLTDAGLIPNYAFPEAGIELKSILWRRKASDETGARNYVALPAIKYERPAASALSEFAPENRFYANQRRVEIDQINMSLAKLENWRLCPSCHHAQNLEREADAHASCPRCGDAMWGNVSQQRQLLRFRQAVANSDDTKVRIDDSAEDREPRFYTRQLLIDFMPNEVKEAWRVSAKDLPFGFEYIARAIFRDINFGEMGHPGEAFKVADVESSRPGFRLCRHCGKVQLHVRPGHEGAEQQHAIDCGQRDTNVPESIVDCLYLYREFGSEALRILVPYTTAGVDEEVIQSFMAALQLGLKKRFGGKVDHLRVTTQDEPGKDGGPRRHYVLLYDSVPGGTGYLHQLLSKDAQTLREVFQLAHAAMSGCSCNQDAEKDGCYRCLYQYKLGRAMEQVSRNRAVEVLSELLAAMAHMEKVPTISDIDINSKFDSVLESRFIECLRRLGGKQGLPAVRLVQDIINGKSGYVIEVDDLIYQIEPQVMVGPEHGVAAMSKPDFMIWPAGGRKSSRPIAVFCDGWAYHKDALREDALKRSALVASGKFWVVSVTHDDVKTALDGDDKTDLESPLTALAWHDGQQAPPQLARAEAGAFVRNAVAFLLRWLGTDEESARLAAARNWAWATYLLIPGPGRPTDQQQVAHAVQTRWGTLPAWMQALASKAVPASSRAEVLPTVQLYWPAAFLSASLTQDTTPGIVLLDDQSSLEDQAIHTAWRQWLRLYHWAQTIPGMILTTASGIEAHDYDALAPKTEDAAQGGGDSHSDSSWQAALQSVVSSLRKELEAVAGATLPAPSEVGYELADDRGEVVAEAELAWGSEHIVVLLDSQTDYAPRWTANGWHVVVASNGWSAVVIAALKNHQGG